MNKILKAINENLTINNQPLGIGLFELFYIKKYGSLEAAQIYFSDLKKRCVNEDEFNIIIEEQFENDFNIKKLQSLGDVFSKINNFSTILNIEKDFENWFINSKISKKDLEKLIELQDLCSSFFREHFHHEREIQRKLLIVKLADKITFTIKETREELGFKNQRTFKKWLDYFYKGKFEGRKTINILEYIDILKKFILGADENKIDINKNAVEYQKRLNEGLVFTKERLKKLTNDDYKILKIEIDSINKEEGIQLPNDVDLYPFSIVDIFKKHLT